MFHFSDQRIPRFHWKRKAQHLRNKIQTINFNLKNCSYLLHPTHEGILFDWLLIGTYLLSAIAHRHIVFVSIIFSYFRFIE